MTRWIGRLAPLFVAVLCAVPPVTDAAAPVTTPPGNSAGNQYVETLPGPKGSQVLSPTAAALPLGAARFFASHGPAGLLVIALGPLTPGLSHTGRAIGTSGAQASAGSLGVPRGKPLLSTPAARPDSPGAAFTTLLVGPGPDGMGWALPVILVAVAVAVLLLGRRRGEAANIPPGP